jgi:peptidoglycan/LPS O-acetylase OafA/YrhL
LVVFWSTSLVLLLPPPISLSASSTAAKPYFPALTGLRAIAAWLIFFYHTNSFSIGSLPDRIISEFHLGVTVFFVLSGLLIGVRYGHQFTLSRRWLGYYVRHRFARIYPLFFLLTCLVFVVYEFVPQYDTTGLYTRSHFLGKALVIGINLTLLRGWFTEFRFTGVYTGWTLTVEEFFYLLAPFLLLGLRRQPKYMLAYCGGLVAIGCLLVALPAPWHRFGFMPSYFFMFAVTFFGRCFEFLGGMYLALLWLRKAPSLDWLSRHLSCTVAGGVWVVGCLGLLILNHALPWSDEWADWGRIVINNLVLVPGICLLLYGLMSEPTRIGRLLGSQPFDLFGKASYALYLIHAGVLDQFLTQHVTTSLLLRFVITNALAIALYKGIEHPLYKRLLPHGTETSALKTS